MAAPPPSSKPSSSSPISSRTTINPISRKSEINNPIRRSLTGNPFSSKPSISASPRGFINPNTPANSPSDYPRRNSMGRESLPFSLWDCEDKENGKDQNMKSAKATRSPSVLKGTKNFMSPTISAASKISPSPKKKILSERNEPVRTSLSFSDLKCPSLNSVNPQESETVNDLKPDSDTNHKSVEGSDLKTPSVSKASKTVRFVEPLDNEEHFELKCPSLNSVNPQESETVNDLKPDSDTNHKSVEASDLKTPSVSKASKTVRFVEPEIILNYENGLENDNEEHDCVNLDPSFKISPPLSSFPILAPLDADPSLPPYDPKTNYLSPRPQFLHYRPNPRIEHYLSMEADGKRLEDSFVTGNLSDTDVTEETQSDESSRKESDEDSSVETSKEVNEEQEEKPTEASSSELLDGVVSSCETMKEDGRVEEVEILEPNLITVEKENVQKGATAPKKPHFFMRHNFTSLLLILFVTGFSIAIHNSSGFDPNMYYDGSVQINPYEIYEFAKANYDGLVQNFRDWSANSINFLSEVIFHFQEAHNSGQGPLLYFNLTALHNDITGTRDFVFDQISEVIEEEGYDLNVLEPVKELAVENIAVPEDEGRFEFEPDNDETKEVSERKEDLEHEEEEEEDGRSEEASEHNAPEIEEVKPASSLLEVVAYENKLLAVQDFKVFDTATTIDDPEEASEHNAPEIEEVKPASSSQLELMADENKLVAAQGFEVYDTVTTINDHIIEQQNFETEFLDQDQSVLATESDKIQLDVNDANIELSSNTEEESESLESEFLVGVNPSSEEKSVVSAIALIATLPLIIATIFIFARRGQKSTGRTSSNSVIVEEQKKKDFSPISVSTFMERRSSRNFPTEVDMGGESCPSEMSSFSSYNSKKELKGTDEAQSHEMKQRKNYYRRESLASSMDNSMSTASPSYGSFTTYEKTQIKKGEEEMITPVRRSSRIRKQVTSP